MGEGLVGFRHLVDVFTTFHCSSGAVGSIEDFAGETHGHRGLSALAGELDQPADRECLTAPGTNLDGYLIGRTADATRTDLDGRPDVVDGPFEDRQGFGSRALLNDVHRAVDDAASSALLAAPEHFVDDLRDENGSVDRIWFEFANLRWCATHA